MTTLVCGITVADYIFKVPAIPDQAQKYQAKSLDIVTGGCGANAAIAIAKLDHRVKLITPLGGDLVGESLCQSLIKAGVDISLVKQMDQVPTPISAVMIDNHGERQIINYRDPALFENGDWVRPALDDILDDHHGITACLCDTRWKSGAMALLNFAKENHISGILDAENPVDDDLLEASSHVIFSLSGLYDWSNQQSIEDGLDYANNNIKSKPVVMVTDGGNGCYYMDQADQSIKNIPAPAVKVVDTLGAGDVWHGAFALKLGLCNDYIEAAKYANLVAAYKCTQKNGIEGAPTQAQLNDFLKEYSVKE